MSSPDDSGASVLRSEEQLHLRIDTVAREKVRVEKVIVTETRTFTVDVRREELRITRTPIGDDHVLTPSEEAPTRQPIVLVLQEERITVAKTVVPVEKIVVNVDTVTGEQQITETLRREQVDTILPEH